MGTSGLAILTDGMIHPGLVEVEVCEAPYISAVAEVRPTIRGTIPPPTVGPAGSPNIVKATELAPQIVKTKGPEVTTGKEEPNIISAEELVPVIRNTEED